MDLTFSVELTESKASLAPAGWAWIKIMAITMRCAVGALLCESFLLDRTFCRAKPTATEDRTDSAESVI